MRQGMTIVTTHPPSPPQPSAHQPAVLSMATVKPLGAVHAAWAGKAPSAMNAYVTRAAFMGCVASHGSVTVRRVGEAYCVTKVCHTIRTAAAKSSSRVTGTLFVFI